MARARTIKPAFFLHEDLATVSPLARLMFIGLWTLADRDGLLEERPRRWKMELLPADHCDPAELLEELVSIGVVERTEHVVDGRKLLRIPKFSKHQHVHHREGSILEDAEKPELAQASPGQTQTSPLARARGRGGVEGRGKKVEGRGEEGMQGGKGNHRPRQTLEAQRLHDAYPEARRSTPNATTIAVREIKAAGKTVDFAIERVRVWERSDQWQKGMIPRLSKWISEGTWLAEPVEPKSPRHVDSNETWGTGGW